MKKVSTAATKQSRNFSQRKLTCGAQKSRRGKKKMLGYYKSWSAKYLPWPFDSSQW